MFVTGVALVGVSGLIAGGAFVLVFIWKTYGWAYVPSFKGRWGRAVVIGLAVAGVVGTIFGAWLTGVSR